MYTNDCTLCDALAENQKPTERKKFYNIALQENEKFAVFPCIGPLVLGHVMVISKKHSTSLASMGKPTVKEYDQFIMNIKKNHELYGDDLLEAEHGSTAIDNAGSCVIHTHIHLIPKFGKFEKIFESKLTPIMTTGKIEQLTNNRMPYIMIRGNSGKTRVFDATNIESQYIRRVLFEIEGREDWDWGAFPHKAIISETILYWQSH